MWQYLAVARGRRNIVKYLHSMGVDLTLYCDKYGFGTPLFHAIHFESIEIISESFP
jgi:hypothetical protein